MKISKTKAENTREVKRLKTIKRALTSSLVGTTGDERKILKSEIESLKEVIEFTTSRKKFLYNFKSGGWNAGYGVTIDEAYKSELKRWGKDPHSPMDRASFRLCTDSEEKSLMSLFY